MRCIYYIHSWGPEPHQGRISNFESEHLGIGNHLGAFLWAWQCSQMVSHKGPSQIVAIKVSLDKISSGNYASPRVSMLLTVGLNL